MSPVVIRVAAIWTFPKPKAPGVPHYEAEVGDGGLQGDRPKKAPLSLVGKDGNARANLVLDCPNSLVESWAGRVVRIGSLTLAVTPTGNACEGVYAAAAEPGRVRVGDVVAVLEDTEL